MGAFMFYGLDETQIFLIILSLVISLWAQFMVKSSFRKYSKINNSKGYTGAQIARDILDKNGLYDVKVEHIRGELTDHFDPRTNVVRLSDSVHSSKSVAAIGVAAHEVGHAIQYAKLYTPMKIRSAVVPTTNIASYLSMFLFMLGMIMSHKYLIDIGIVLFCLIIFFQLITLPVEFNASARAMKTLQNDNLLIKEELSGARKVLTAAALTYVAAFITAILQLLRLIALANRRR